MEYVAQILVLEDDNELRQIMAEVLQDEGYGVVAVSRGEDAVALANQQEFDLIVSDIRMDGMDGLEAISQTSQLQPAMGSLVVSGYCTEKETLRAIDLKVGGYLRKPFVIHEFLQSVRSVLQRQEVQRNDRNQLDQYRQVWLWTHRQLLGSLEQQRFPGLLRWWELGQRLAQQLGLAETAAERVLSGLAWQLLELPDAPGWPQSAGPEESEFQTLCRELWPYAGGEWPAALAAPGSARLQAAYQQALNQEMAPRSDGSQPRGMLALAQTLEEAQQTAAARQAYQQLLRRPGALAGQACLGLARLAWKEQDQAEWTRRLEDLKTLSASGGYAQALTELAVLSRQPSLLEQAQQAFQGQPQSAEFCLLQLADGQAAEGAKDQAALQLLSARFRPHFARHAGWLVAEVLLRVDVAKGGRRLAFMALDFSPQIARLMGAEQLPKAALLNLLEVFQRFPQELPGELVQALLSHSEVEIRQQARLLDQGQGSSSLRLHSFGAFTARCGVKTVEESEWRTQKIKYMLAYLASRWDRPVVEDELIELFWPEARGTGKRNLYVAATTLRKALRPNQEAREVDFVVRHQGRLGLNLQLPIWHDASEAESTWSKAQEALKSGQPGEACECFRQLCDLAGGDFLEGCYLDWALRRRAQWTERFSQASLHLCKTALERQGWEEAADWAQRSLQWEPADLDTHQALLRAYLGLRQPEAVIRSFEAAAHRLRRDYELEPSTEMLELYHRARHGIYS